MKKMMFVAAMAAMVFTSCMKEETVNDGTKAVIGVDMHIAKTTKGTPATSADYAKDGATMKIWAYMTDAAIDKDLAGATKLIDGVTATRTSGVWKYTPEAYWRPAKQHHFLAVAPADAAGCDIDASGVATIAVASTIAEQKDILLAEPLVNKAYAESPDKIQFYLRHALSQVRIRVKFIESETISSMTVDKVVIKPSSGQFLKQNTMKMLEQTIDAGHSTAFAYEAATQPTTGGEASYTFTPTSVSTVYDTPNEVFDGKDGVAMLMPQTANAKLEATVFITCNGTQKEIEFSSNNTINWEPNKVYVYNITISVRQDVLGYRGMIFGDPTVESWGAENAVD